MSENFLTIQTTTTFQPTDISGCTLWLKADAGITKDGSDYVSSWADQSGNGNDAVQGTGVSQPLYVANQLNGEPVIRFDGSNDWMGFNAINNIRSVFIVLKHATGAQTSAPILGHSALYDFVGGSAASPNTRIFSSQASAYILSGSGYINGVNISPINMNKPTNYSIVSLITTNNVGAQYITNDRNVAGRVWNGDYSEIIIYNSALSDSDRQKVESYLDAKYNITGTGITPSETSEFILAEQISIPFQPTDLSNLKLWLKADAGITKDGSNYVSSWADQSGNGNDATQLVGSSQPLWSGNTLNGNPVIRFDGSDTMNLLSLMLLTNTTIFTVFKKTLGSNAYILGNSLETFPGLANWSNNYSYYQDEHQWYTYANTGEITVYSILSLKYSTSPSVEYWVNGVSKGGTISSVPSDVPINVIGGRVAGDNLNGDIAEIVVYNTELSTSERQKVESYLDAKYNITGTGTTPTNISYNMLCFTLPAPSFQPSGLSGLTLWLKADAGITKDGSDYVSVWADQSGNGNDATQVIGAYQPQYIANVLNGEPVIRFGSGDRFDINSITIHEYSLFIVYKKTGGQGVIFGNTITNDHMVNWISGEIYVLDNALGHQLYYNVTANNYSLFNNNSDVATASNAYYYANGTDTLITNSGSQNYGTYNFNLIGYCVPYSRVMIGDVCEIIIYSRKLSNQDRVLVRDYLTSKYGL